MSKIGWETFKTIIKQENGKFEIFALKYYINISFIVLIHVRFCVAIFHLAFQMKPEVKGADDKNPLKVLGTLKVIITS